MADQRLCDNNETLEQTATYQYNNPVWKDQLTSYNGNQITYDGAGNPINYYNGYKFDWVAGRRLSNITKSTAEDISFTYNEDGIRTSKTRVIGSDNMLKTTYELEGSNVVVEKNHSYIQGVSETHNYRNLYYMYDDEDDLRGFYLYETDYQGNASAENGFYYYKKNLQGDIIGILDESLDEVVKYEYDAWGKILSTTGSKASTVGNYNPYRYRGYRYDSETGLYYLQSRYYDPEIGRFINADVMLDTENVLGLNLFAYCANNPIIYADLTGYGRIYVIYYNNPGSGFYEQAMNSPYYNRKNKNVYMISVTSSQDFINAWNSMSGIIDYVYLYLHGGKGVLYFKGGSLSFSNKQSFSNLNFKKVRNRVYLFSCKGGAGSEGNNVAWMFAKLTDSKVYACTGSVSFSKIFGKYYARKAWDWGIIKTFYYQKRYIFWGTTIAKSVAGQW